MTEVVVYTQPNCQPCKATLRRFNTAGIVVVEKQAADHADLLIVPRFLWLGWSDQ